MTLATLLSVQRELSARGIETLDCERKDSGYLLRLGFGPIEEQVWLPDIEGLNVAQFAGYAGWWLDIKRQERRAVWN